MKLNTWQWFGVALLIVCLGLYVIRQVMLPDNTVGGKGPPAGTSQPAATKPVSQPAK